MTSWTPKPTQIKRFLKKKHGWHGRYHATWCFQPICKHMLVKLDHLPRGENLKTLETTTLEWDAWMMWRSSSFWGFQRDFFWFALPGAFIMTSTFKSLRGGRYVFSPEAKLVLRWTTSKVPVKYGNWSLNKSSYNQNQTYQAFGCSMFEYVLVIWSKCWKFLDYTLKVSDKQRSLGC